jgi:hypothetical protein
MFGNRNKHIKIDPFKRRHTIEPTEVKKNIKPTPIEVLLESIDPQIITNQITNKGIIFSEDKDSGKNKNILSFDEHANNRTKKKINHKRQYLPGERLLQLIAREKPEYLDNIFVNPDEVVLNATQ